MPMNKNQVKAGFLILLLVFALFVSFSYDYEIVNALSGIHNSLLDSFMMWVTFAGSTLFILFFLTSLFLWHERKRRWILPLWMSLGISSFFISLLKYLLPKIRPFGLGVYTLPVMQYTVSLNSSFPSLHAASAFCALPVLNREFPDFRLLWIGFAFLVALSRVYFALHYMSDVIIGAFIGYCMGYMALRLEEKYKYSGMLYIKRK